MDRLKKHYELSWAILQHYQLADTPYLSPAEAIFDAEREAGAAYGPEHT
jgi:hypothetical protein